MIGGGLALLALFAFTWDTSDFNRAAVERWVDMAGAWGPLAIVMLMTVAIVASPLPSAPIALAAGAAYGHYAGALYVAIGSEAGALIAFAIARGLGRETVQRWVGDTSVSRLMGSQNALTLAVFVSRLLPFVSFDAMSYAAGLSQLHPWRFALATLAGILPASFVLAHFGSVAVNTGFGTAEWLVLGLGVLTALPLVLLALRGNSSTERTHDPAP
jgi:uncharacterized membrane protein YdjX (TVP38/TMEM64 family)